MVFLIIAKTYGLSMLPTYLDLTNGQDIRHGVNLSFFGVGALHMDYFIQNRLMALAMNDSLSIQLYWFKRLKPSLCKNKGFYQTSFSNILDTLTRTHTYI